MSNAEDTTAVDYESMTVAELKEELTARGLPTSGTKDQLVARLDEDDADEAANAEDKSADVKDAVTATSTDLVTTQGTEDAPVADPNKRVYSPYELPADPFAAQAFADANPDAVDPALELPPERQALAVANIQDSVDAYAAQGMTVEDPRLSGTETPPPDPPPDPEEPDPDPDPPEED